MVKLIIQKKKYTHTKKKHNKKHQVQEQQKVQVFVKSSGIAP
jgi:hypothetical protein